MIISRFAPSPTGFLHLGHAYSALFAYNLASVKNGILKLRIENIDLSRCKKVYEERIYEDLLFLGIKWEKNIILSTTLYLLINKIKMLPIEFF